jgi:hypothetical protein
MRTLFIGTGALLALGLVPAFASDGGDMQATARFTLAADAQAQQVHGTPVHRMHAESRQEMRVNAAQARGLGTWLYPPAQSYGQN